MHGFNTVIPDFFAKHYPSGPQYDVNRRNIR